EREQRVGLRLDGAAWVYSRSTRRVVELVRLSVNETALAKNGKDEPSMTGREHTLVKTRVLHKWDRRIPPAIEIESGDTVHCETAEDTNNQITAGCPARAPGAIEFWQLFPLAGPI